ncbi:MAG: glycosyltransferase family 2 protein [Gemmatimonadota bacterium]
MATEAGTEAASRAATSGRSGARSARTPEEAAGALSDEMRRDFAVVVPAYDEAPVIPALIRELREAFEEHDLEGEVVLVDDGSTDGTAELAKREGKGWSALRVLRHRTNRGKTEAMLTAFHATERSYLILFDADLQHLPREIPRFLAELQEGWDIVTARKVGEYGKRAVSSIYNWLSRKFFDVPVSDLNSMKGFHRSVLEGPHLRHDWHRFFVILAAHRGATITEIDVPLHPRRAGRPKYSGRFRIVVGFLDLISVWFLLAFSRKPLLLFGLAGVVLMAAGVGVGGVAFYLRFVHELGFRPLLYLVILLETMGAILLGVGLLAEMVAQLREELDQLRGQVERES